jgi:hypothetical protein
LSSGLRSQGWGSFFGVDAAGAPVTFSKDTAPIVFAKCGACHHPDELQQLYRIPGRE